MIPDSLLALSSGPLVATYGILFVAVLLLVESALQLLLSHRSGPQAQVNRRLRMLEAGLDPQEVLRRLRHRKAGGRAGSPIARLEWMILRAGLQTSATRYLILMLALALLAAGAVRLSGVAGLPVAAAVGAVCGIAAPLGLLGWLYRRRLKVFAEQLPEAIDLLVRSLRAGHPLNSGLRMVAEELPDPIGTEFGIVVDETTYGLDLQEAIANLSERIDVPDLHYLSISVRIHYGTGGNLAEVLENLSKLIRARFQMFRKVRAVTSEGRLSAWFLSIFPIVMGAVLISIKSDYYATLQESSLFPWIAGLTVALLVVNIIVMRWLVNIKV